MQTTEGVGASAKEMADHDETGTISLTLEEFLRKHYYQLLVGAEVLFDFLCVFGSFLLARLLYDSLRLTHFADYPLQPMTRSMMLQVAVISLLTTLILGLMGLYTKQLSMLNIDEMRKLFRSVLLIAILFFVISFYFRIPFSRMVITVWLLCILFSLIVEKMIFFKLHQYFHVKGLNIRRVLIYGAGEIGRKLYKRICSFPKLGYQAVGFIDDDMSAFAEQLNRVDVEGRHAPALLGTSEELERVAREHRIDELFIARKGMSSEEIVNLTDRCKRLGVQFKIIPQLFGYFIENLSLQDIGGIPLIGEKETKIRKFDLFTKRIMDFCIAVFVLVFFAPVFLAIGVLIRVGSPGPVIFRQRRVGRSGKEFTIYKFRTMYTDAAKYSFCPRDSEDPRITRVGKYLRKTSLDELPQFLNVLRGEMSIVGPRPEMPFIVAQYNPLHRKRLSMKPGITGLWQISADRYEEIHENIDYDLYYVDNFTLLLDVAIIVRTIFHAMLAMKTS